jgi:GT2 family glycosyltransferase
VVEAKQLQLSVIIVNYNVKHFLEQCLCSVRKALKGIEGEVIVVDNNSSDNSLSYLIPVFPEIKFIQSNENLGFARACNLGLTKATGDHILFLNPDTLLPEECLHQCLGFFSTHPEAGAVGVRMLDGRGKFLKESKRAFPSPKTSLYKLLGLARLFPESKVFARYHLGYLKENQDHEIDVLAGAFMMVKNAVLEKVGGFDETFFMYGEDVDLSYRIQKAGYTNYYFAGANIIHFKGESTRKGSMNYVRMFYNAMSIFVRKHYGGGKANIFNFLIHLAIWVRAAFTAAGHFIRRVGLPLIDASLILLSFWLVKTAWNEYVRTDTLYENRLLWIAFPSYTMFYLIAAYYAGLYDRWYKWTELFRSSVVATIVLLAAYALLPEHYRFSRAIILFGAIMTFVLIGILRWMLLRTNVLLSKKEKDEPATTVIVATANEYAETMQVMQQAGAHERVLGRIAINDDDNSAIGSVKNLPRLISSIPFREIIFCQGALTYNETMTLMHDLPKGLKVKFHAAGTNSIVGSESKDSSGEALSKENGFRIANPYNRRVKRLIDVLLSIALLITFPIQVFLVKNAMGCFSNCFLVLFGRKTWVGYISPEKNLPPIRDAIIANNGLPVSAKQQLPAESQQMMDYWYARDYEPYNDLKLIRLLYRRLGE